MSDLIQAEQDALDAAAFRRLLKHLDDNKDVAAAEDAGHNLNMDEAREHIYGMPYSEWKLNHQPKATPEQLAAFEARTANKT